MDKSGFISRKDAYITRPQRNQIFNEKVLLVLIVVLCVNDHAKVGSGKVATVLSNMARHFSLWDGMSDEENSGVFSRRKDHERRVPVAILPLPPKEKQVRK